jgi:hypothetical protein
MIVHWEATGLDQFQTTWRGMLLTLLRTPQEFWRLVVSAEAPGEVLGVNGKKVVLVRQRWHSGHGAMRDVDVVMERVLRGLSRAQGGL